MEDNCINIRKATPTDLNGIIEIENLCFNDDKFSKEQFAYLISYAKGVFYVVESNDSILGYISLLQRSNSKILRIYSVAVHPSTRGRQIGQKLIEASKEFAKINEFKQISLEVRTDNIAAINLYNKNGFIVTGIIKGYYGNGIDGFRMEAIL